MRVLHLWSCRHILSSCSTRLTTESGTKSTWPRFGMGDLRFLFTCTFDVTCVVLHYSHRLHTSLHTGIRHSGLKGHCIGQPHRVFKSPSIIRWQGVRDPFSLREHREGPSKTAGT
jgi:hypothetical protein